MKLCISLGSFKALWSRKSRNVPLNLPPSDVALGALQIIFRIKWSVSCPTERKWSSSCRLFEVSPSLNYSPSHIDTLCRSVLFNFRMERGAGRCLPYQSLWTSWTPKTKTGDEKWHLHIKSQPFMCVTPFPVKATHLLLLPSCPLCSQINYSISGRRNPSHTVLFAKGYFSPKSCSGKLNRQTIMWRCIGYMQ